MQWSEEGDARSDSAAQLSMGMQGRPSEEFTSIMKEWIKKLMDLPPAGSKMMAFIWPTSRRCSSVMLFETEEDLRRYKESRYADVMRSTSRFLENVNGEASFDDHGKVWKSSSRQTMEEGMHHIRMWSLTCKDGKERQMEDYLADAFYQMKPDDDTWLMYSCSRPAWNRWCLCIAHRNGSLADRYVMEEQDSIKSGRLSDIVDGTIYDDHWFVDSVVYP